MRKRRRREKIENINKEIKRKEIEKET